MGYGFGFGATIGNGTHEDMTVIHANHDMKDDASRDKETTSNENNDIVGAILHNASKGCFRNEASASSSNPEVTTPRCEWPCICSAAQDRVYEILRQMFLYNSSVIAYDDSPNAQCLASFLYVKCGRCNDNLYNMTSNSSESLWPPGTESGNDRYQTLLRRVFQRQIDEENIDDAGRQESDYQDDDKTAPKLKFDSHCWSQDDDKVPFSFDNTITPSSTTLDTEIMGVYTNEHIPINNTSIFSVEAMWLFFVVNIVSILVFLVRKKLFRRPSESKKFIIHSYGTVADENKLQITATKLPFTLNHDQEAPNLHIRRCGESLNKVTALPATEISPLFFSELQIRADMHAHL